jgi:hypothetical protein
MISGAHGRVEVYHMYTVYVHLKSTLRHMWNGGLLTSCYTKVNLAALKRLAWHCRIALTDRVMKLVPDSTYEEKFHFFAR